MNYPNKIFVTGGSGFLGANLVAELNRLNIPVRILCRESSNREALKGLSYEEVIGDVESEPELLAEAIQGCDWVFHAAAATQYWRSSESNWIYKTNVQGTCNMLAAARIANVKRFIFTSSVASMGIPASGEVLTESAKFNLKPKQFIYGHSKYLAEAEVEKAAREGLPVVILNPTIMIGPRDINQLSGAIILEAWRGRLIVAPPGGINFVAVEDVVQAHLAAAMHGRLGERYLIAGENLNYKEAIAIVCHVMGKSASRWVLPRACVPALSLLIEMIQQIFGKVLPLDATQLRISAEEIYVDASKAREEFGIEITPFRVAVERAYQWYREQAIIT